MRPVTKGIKVKDVFTPHAINVMSDRRYCSFEEAEIISEMDLEENLWVFFFWMLYVVENIELSPDRIILTSTANDGYPEYWWQNLGAYEVQEYDYSPALYLSILVIATWLYYEDPHIDDPYKHILETSAVQLTMCCPTPRPPDVDENDTVTIEDF